MKKTLLFLALTGVFSLSQAQETPQPASGVTNSTPVQTDSRANMTEKNNAENCIAPPRKVRHVKKIRHYTGTHIARTHTASIVRLKPVAIDLSKNPPVPLDPALPNSDNTDVYINYSQDSKGFSHKTVYDLAFTHNGQPLGEDDFTPLPSGANVEVHNVNSDLTQIIDGEVDVSNAETHYLVPSELKGKGCQAFYVTYHLKGDVNALTQGVILNKAGEPVLSMDKKCAAPDIDWRHFTDHTADDYTVGINWLTPYNSSLSPVVFDSTFTFEGDEVFPDNPMAYVISLDFTRFYAYSGIESAKGPFYGIRFTQMIEKGSYYFSVGFDGQNAREWVSTKALVQ